jgi:hypothetical protein
MGTPFPCKTGTPSGEKTGKLVCTKASHKPTQAPAGAGPSWKRRRCPLFPTAIVGTLLVILQGVTGNNSHRPYKQTWVLRSGDTHEEWNLTSHLAAAQWTWWPKLYVDLEMVLGTFYNLPQNQQGHYMKKRALGDTSSLLDRQALRSNGFFACPGYESGTWRWDCRGIESFYCAH